MNKKYPIPPSSQGYRKMWEYYKYIVRTEEFQQDINKARYKLEIKVNKKYPNMKFWKNTQKEKIVKLMKIIDHLCKKYKLFEGHWWATVEHYLFTGELWEPGAFIGDLLTLTDKDEFAYKKRADSFARFYPIIIGIHPHASKRDMLDWISDNYQQINFFQKMYRLKENKIGRIRSKKNETRDEFIYQNKTMPLKKLEEALFTQGHNLDPGEITKIVSIETARRKKV